MRDLNLILRSGLLVVAVVAWAGPAARAQGYGNPNADFDRRMNQMLTAAQQQNTASMNGLWQYHLRVNGPRLRAQYRQARANGSPLSFEQFAYWDLMTAGGTNIQGGIDAQRRQFEGTQAANRTVQSGHQSYNNGWWVNTRRSTDAVENFSNQAILGLSPYVNTQTGAVQMLPYSSPPGQIINSGGNYYVQNQSGTYFRWTGSSWAQMQPGR